MGFSIQDYLRDNKIELGKHEKEVGDTPYKGGHNDIRKTNYDVKFTEDGKLDLYTHKKVVVEGKSKNNSKMIKLGGLVNLKPINEDDSDKYTHIGYGKYKLKGKEDDKTSPTFEKDGEKFVPTKGDTAAKGGDSSAGKETPKVNIFNKDKQEPKGDTPKKQPSQPKLESDPQAEKVAEKLIQKRGITPEKMGEEDYKVAMARAVYSALTNSNFHTEARELVAMLEDKPELAEKPEYPPMSDPQWDEKMKAIRQKYASTYTERDDISSELGRETSDAAEWDGIKSVGTLTKQLRDNDMSDFADKIESIFDKKEYMKKEGRISISNLVKESNTINEGTRSQVGVIDKNGKIVSAYVHFDGYPSNMKPGIKKHMKNEKDVLTLIKNGGARGIFDDKEIEYYNDKSAKPIKGTLDNVSKFIKDADRQGGAEYVYLYNTKDKKWYFADTYKDDELKKLY